MKTKIIYISGAEVFDMADVRAAFDEVRAALNLGPDTVMFGVPVDADSAIGPVADAASDVAADADGAPASDVMETQVADDADDADVADVAEEAASPELSEEIPDMSAQEVAESVAEDIVEEVATPTPKKRATRSRKKVVPIAPVQEESASETDHLVVQEVEVHEEIVAQESAKESAAAPIPILSVLASNAMAADDDVQFDSDVATDDIDADVVQDAPADDFADDMIDEDDAHDEDMPGDVMNQDALADMITDDAPVDAGEKTLEELLESMAPLREDVLDTDDADIVSDADDDDFGMAAIGGGDATLEQLAAEFVQNEDKIVSEPKPAGRGKIGKLKNILPFKKAKRDDNGLMGDLFGWAGIAANDDDFSIPGFFTPNAQKN